MSSVTAARVRSAPLVLVRGVPAWAWLTGLVALSATLRIALARHMVGPWIIVDELVYSELAKSVAETGRFLVRDEPVGLGFGAVYPIVISPAYLIQSMPDAYAAVKAINAVVISLAAVPAYLLARRAVSTTGALVVAALSLAVPSLVYAGTVMTENAFYPAFLLAALALVRALERPTPGRTAVLLATVGIAFLTRVQAVVLVAAVVTAPLLLAAWERRPRAVLAYRWLYGGLAAAAVAVLGVAALRGRGPLDLLGAYKVAGESDYTAGEVSRWLLYHVGELDLYVGVVPFAALLLLLLIGGRLDRDARIVVAAAGTVTAWLVLQVAAFASLPSVQRIEERNVFYVAPLLFTCLVLWIERGAPRPPLRTAFAAGAAAALPAFVPYERFINTTATSDTLSMLSLWSLAESAAFPLDDVWLYVLGGAIVAVALFVSVPARWGLVLPALLLVLYAFAAQPIDARTEEASVGALFQGITRPDRDWIDATVGPDADVAVLWTGRTDRFTVIQNEFFNRSVRRIYYTGEPVPGSLAQSPAAVDRSDGLLRDGGGTAVRAGYLLADDSLPIDARIVARDRKRGLRLYALDGPARVSSVTDGVYGDGWSGAEFTYTGFRCSAGSLTVRLGSDPGLFLRPQTVTAYVNGRAAARMRVSPTAEETVWRVPVQPGAGGRCIVHFAVASTAVPAEERPGSDDTRRLGIRVLAFER